MFYTQVSYRLVGITHTHTNMLTGVTARASACVTRGAVRIEGKEYVDSSWTRPVLDQENPPLNTSLSKLKGGSLSDFPPSLSGVTT